MISGAVFWELYCIVAKMVAFIGELDVLVEILKVSEIAPAFTVILSGREAESLGVIASVTT